MLGFDSELKIVNLGDTAELYATLYDQADQPVDVTQIESAQFLLQRPDGSLDSVDAEIQDDGSIYAVYNSADQVGEYKAVAQFSLAGGITKSVSSDFMVSDPFDISVQNPADYFTLTNPDDQAVWQVTLVADKVWDKLEDLFDSTDGGPWMRDMTLNVFNPEKVPDFITEALFDINVWNPQTNFWIDKFTLPINLSSQGYRHNENLPILVQGTWLAVIRHLMRSYAEQPLPQGGQVPYEDRRDYLQRWGTIYQIEKEFYEHLVKMWKRQFLQFGTSKILVSNKAGRLLPAPLRTRNIGRGFY